MVQKSRLKFLLGTYVYSVTDPPLSYNRGRGGRKANPVKHHAF